ncbi:MAG: AraC family transcriptional regulator [Moraxellaceae bacterium]|nr:AraC family transcriptional regulator [Moraxellaceae bacterium]
MDALSELLRAVRLSGAMFFNAHCAAPWCVASPPSQRFVRYVASESCRLIEFHFIAAGQAYIRVGGETTPLAAGDIVMLPHGDAHHMGNGLSADIIDGEASASEMLTGAVKLSKLGSGDGDSTRLICGYLACEARLIQPLIAGLPRVVRVNIRHDAYGRVLEEMIHHAVAQLDDDAPGSKVIGARLAEVLFAESLRRYLLQMPPGASSWLAGAADPAVGRALAALHQDPAHAWTLDELAKQAGLARSSLTERFARHFGQGPMGYLADWRLELAADALRSTSRSVMQIASEVGYDSEAAFNRAFKRRFELPPGRYRLQWREGRPAPLATGTGEHAQ